MLLPAMLRKMIRVRIEDYNRLSLERQKAEPIDSAFLSSIFFHAENQFLYLLAPIRAAKPEIRSITVLGKGTGVPGPLQFGAFK